ncbi:hypothetical protein TeGR_g5040, partial [Tetraparma gracilis]
MSTPSPTPVETETEEPPLFAPFYGFSQHSWGSSESGISSFLLVYLALLSLCLLAAYYLDHLKHRRASLSPAMRFVSAYVSESGAIILIGALAGALLTGIDSAIEADPDALSVGLLQFSSTTFFLLLLPPIIFNSGYHINRGLFFPLLPAISAYAIIGTTVSAVVVGVGLSLCRGLFGASFAPSTAELLAFGALISATDPVSTLATFQSKKVDPVLFYLVFGESVVNDAVGLVLFETLKKFVGYEHDATSAGIALLDFCVIFFGSTVLGILVGMVSSCLFRRVDFRPYPHLEISIYVLIVYVPFIIAEVLSLSGIVTILFTGIVCKCYAHQSLTSESKVLADGMFRILAHLAETTIFLELGLAVFGMTSHGNFHAVFIVLAMVACTVGRALNVYPLSFVLNRCCYTGDSPKIPAKTQHML